VRTFLTGPILALLPERWRPAATADSRIQWPLAACISGFAEAVICLAGLIGWYFYSMSHWVVQVIYTGMQVHPRAPIEEQTVGYVGLGLFLSNPLTWALAYFSAEGAIRGFAGYITGETVGTLPLVLLERAVKTMRRRAMEWRIPLAPDRVIQTPGGASGDLQIASCRPKPHWNHPLTVRVGDEFFLVTGEQWNGADAARPHVYSLRRLARGEIVRGGDSYDPDAVLHEKDSEGLFKIVARELRLRYQIRKLPLVADETSLREDADGQILEVRSCRPKPAWATGRLVFFDGNYFRIEQIEEELASRPFVFRLRRLPAGVPSRSVLQYSPEEVLAGQH
jgi:hypothetical protein